MHANEIIYLTRHRLKKYTIREHLAGLWISRKFRKHGIIVATGGRPFPKIINNGGRLIAKNCQFYSGVRMEIGKNALIDIGNGTYINRNTLIVCQDQVTIGRNCKIAWDVIIMDSDLHPLNSKKIRNKPVVIEDNVWIGCRSIILKGVRIGKGSVIAAGSIVTKDIPSGDIAGGNPVRILKKKRMIDLPSTHPHSEERERIKIKPFT